MLLAYTETCAQVFSQLFCQVDAVWLQVDINNVQHSISLIHFQSGSGPAPPAGAPSRGVPGGTRAAGGFVPVRPARRSRMGHEENQGMLLSLDPLSYCDANSCCTCTGKCTAQPTVPFS